MNKKFSNFSSLPVSSWPFFLLIRGYQLLRDTILTPLLFSAFGHVGGCRYEETCSRYSIRMLQEHATIPALGKILARLASCHGFSSENNDKKR
jgi:putative component of membrane protein insertase Oxa1/YidC/SpoIIIJ protein YidD